MVTFIRRLAFELLRPLPSADRKDYRKLSAALNLHSGKQQLHNLLQIKLRTRKKEVGKNFRDFEVNARRVLYKTYPTAPAKLFPSHDNQLASVKPHTVAENPDTLTGTVGLNFRKMYSEKKTNASLSVGTAADATY